MTQAHPTSLVTERYTAASARDTHRAPPFGVRTAEIAALRRDGSTVFGQRRIPMLAPFEDACAAFLQGTLLKSRDGLTAVEDLRPGDWLSSGPGRFEQVVWIGSIVTGGAGDTEALPLTRIETDSLGICRPEHALTLGPGARLSNGRAAVGLIDGQTVVQTTPARPVRLFNIALRVHAPVWANGLEVDSYTANPNLTDGLAEPLRQAYLSLFPHLGPPAAYAPKHSAYTNGHAAHA